MKRGLSILFVTLLTLFVALSVTYADGAVSTVDGASIRTTGEQGLRFYAKLEVEDSSEHGFYLLYGEAMVSDLEEALENEIPSFNGKQVFKQVILGVDNNNMYSVVLINIPELGYLDRITAIPYAVLDESIHFGSPVTRSVAEVAFKMHNAGDTSDVIESIVDLYANYRKFEYMPYGEYAVTGNYEMNPVKLKVEFIKDWNAKFNTNLLQNADINTFHNQMKSENEDKTGQSNTNVSTTKMYQFFNDALYGAKWRWVLEYLEPYGRGTTHVSRQALALLDDGTHAEGLHELIHISRALYGFFTVSNAMGGYPGVSFEVNETTLTRYMDVKNFNNKILINLGEQEIHVSGSIIDLPEISTKEGYETNGKYKYNNVDYENTLTLGNIGLVRPNYSLIQYPINYYDGENLLELSPATYTIVSGAILPNPEKPGFIFLGWYDNPDFLGSPVIEIVEGSREEKTFYAKYEASTFETINVTFSLNGGQLNSTDLYTYRSGLYIEATRYSTNGDGDGNRITVGTSRGGAYWYVIGLKSTGFNGIYEVVGKGTGYSNEQATLYVSYHDSIISPYKDQMTSTYSTIKAGDLVVIEWLPSEVTSDTSIDMYFFLNPVVASQDLTLSMTEPRSLSFLVPVRIGYKFDGWYDNEGFIGNSISDYPGFTNDDNVTTVTYYAKWIAQ